MELLAITAPLYIVNGETKDAAAVAGLLAQPAPNKSARGRERDYLFAHLSLSGPAEATGPLYEELIGVLSSRYYQSTGSVTAALRKSVIELNDRLLRHNLSNRTSHEGALTCAVLHGNELFMLQVGEALAFLGHNFGVERLPMQTTESTITPLGRSAGIDIRFAYHVLQIGDMLLLADPRVAYLNGTALGPILVDAAIETSVDELTALVGGDSARLLLAEFTDEIPLTLPVGLTRTVSPGASKTSGKSSGKQPTTPATAPTAPPPAPKREAGQPPIQTSPAPGVSGAARAAAASGARGLSTATGWMAGMVGKDSTPAEADEPAYSWALPAFLAVLIPIVIGIVVTSVYLQRGNVQRVGEIKQEMVEQMLLADQAIDDNQVRMHYQSVLSLAAEGDTLRPGDGEISRMRIDARARLDRLDGVSRLQVSVFDELEATANLTAISLPGSGEGYFMLDSAANRVLFRGTVDGYTAKAEATPQPIAAGGQAVGNQVMGTLVDIMWKSAEETTSREGLNILDRTGVLYTHYPNMGDYRAVPLSSGGAWLNPLKMSNYGGRLYVLDTGAQQIWKYYPDGDGYYQMADDVAISLAEGSDLGNAVDFDIYSEDASLVIIYRDGRLRYYDTRSGRVQWDETTLQNNGLKSPMVSPVDVAIVGRGLNASIFVLDPGSGRVIQIARSGKVLAQYRALDETGNELLAAGTSFALTDTPLRVFITAGNKIYLATRN